MYFNRFTHYVCALMLAMAALLLPASVTQASELPDLGDPSATILSAEEDKRLGQAFMRNMRQHAVIIDDPEINAYINSVGYRLLSSAETDLPFHFFIVDAPSINAFAGPGGHIGLHSGLILAAHNEGELAAVMAHEISHVTQRHLARAFQKATDAQIHTIAAVLAALLLGVPPDVTLATVVTATAGNIQQQLNFTRAHEREADRVGVDVLANSGYDPRYMPAFFGRLQEAYRYMENGIPELLRTHPVTPNRIADSQNRAERYPAIPDQDSGHFALIKAKLQSLQQQDNGRYRMKDLKAQQETNSLSAAERYEYARFQLAHNHLDSAAKLSQILIKESPENIHYIVLQVEVRIQQKQYQAARQQLSEALLLFPANPKLTLLYADMLTQLDEAPKAAKLLRELIRQSSDFMQPLYYQELAKAEFAAEQHDRAYHALAEYYYITGNARSAVEQMQSALDAVKPDDDYQYEKLEARLAELKAEALIEKQLYEQRQQIGQARNSS